jgi:hypothetical protein
MLARAASTRSGRVVGLRQELSDDNRGQDRHLPFLTDAQADRVRYLVRQAFAEHGREVTVYPHYLRDDQGDEFGLWNVAAACYGDPRGESAWVLVVTEYVRSLLEHVDHHSLGELTPEEVRSRTYVKLSPADTLPSRDGLSYLDETVPGLVDSLVLDFPNTVSWLRDSDLERFGGKAALRDAGLCNLRALPVEQLKHITTPDGGVFEVLLGESVYTASRVLVMEDLLAHTLGMTDARYGVLATMAARNQIAIHVIRSRSVIPSLRNMARFALAGFSDATGPLSPNVFWWQNGSWKQLTQRERDGTISVIKNPDLTRIIQQIDDQ